MSRTFLKYKKQRIYADFQTFLYFKTISKHITLNIEAIFFSIANKYLYNFAKYKPPSLMDGSFFILHHSEMRLLFRVYKRSFDFLL